MKTFMLTIMAVLFLLSFSTNSFSQELIINLTFTSDTVIYPFENIELISDLTMDGDVELYSDTSMVRVILEDEYGFHYMIFESYPLICPGNEASPRDYCDETCFLDMINPYSLIIQVIDGELELSRLFYDSEPKSNAIQQQYDAKRDKDAKKIETMNEQIGNYNMKWIAGDNGIVAYYYDQKRKMFGDGYNLLGYDYYHDGVFEFLGHSEYPQVDPDLVRHFDWRERHGANDSLSYYYDGDTLGTGWLTSVKDQQGLANCWAFSALGITEAIANLYSNDHIDFNLSEQHLISCYDGDCDGGNAMEALGYMIDHSIVNESCFPYDPLDCTSDSCNNKCTNPLLKIKIEGEFYVDEDNFDSIRISLINHGPLTVSYFHEPYSIGNHAVVLSGFDFDNIDSSCTWIIKNSWGVEDGWGKNGFCRLKVDKFFDSKVGGIETPIYSNDTVLNINCWDIDGDSLCNWGISGRPENCPCYCDTVEDCNDNDPFVGGYDENYNCSCIFEMDENPHHITADTTWSDTTYVNYQVIIDPGACLTISSYAGFAPEAGIQVSQGGTLVLDSAYLTKVCPELWQGIEVLGTDTLQVLDEYFGKVEIRNNSIIEFAEVGIANHCRSCGYEDVQSGGIISAGNSIFRDNEKDILLNPFSTFWFNHDLPYACIISDCRFVTTDNFYPDHVPQTHIEMKDIYGVMIYGCRFENRSDTANWFPIRGAGISSIDSYFMINRYCLTPGISPCDHFDTCNFALLEYGIKAMNSQSKRTLNIQGLQFDTNMVSISLSGLENASVLSNQFIFPKKFTGVAPDRFTGGLFMEGCTGYHVEDNFFLGEKDSMARQSPSQGIGIKNSGMDNNEIYNNRFQKVNTGIVSIGENRGKESGLCLKCNDMVLNINDFVVVSDTTLQDSIYQGINYYQGDPADSTSFNAPAGNTFTTSMGSVDSLMIKNYNYYNSAEDVYYTHHHQVNIKVRPMDNHYTSSTIDLKGWTLLNYFKETACPSGLGGGGGLKSYSSPRSIINEANIQMDILRTQLNALIDGGNTEELNFEVMTSLPDDGLEIRQDLLNVSPYLSDTVMKQAIYKEDVLPNAMIRDVLEANPQSAKSDEIINTLDSRYDPMPDYMMEQIMEGKKYLGAKEILEAKIQSLNQIRSKAKADLMREFLLDSNMISPLDSVIAFLEDETDLYSKYDLALAQWDNSYTEGAWVTLNAIPSQFNFSENQSVDHDNYLDYFNVLQTLADSNWQANQLDSASVSLLLVLKESGNPRIAALSRGLLVKGGFYRYIETIILPDFTKSSCINPKKYNNRPEIRKEEKLWLFPNPAGDYIIAYYDLDPRYKTGEIHLIDMKGNMLISYKVRNGKDQIVIDLKAYPIGLYIISLNSRNQVLESKKFSKGGH